MNVLELGCGAGVLTLDDGLYGGVGASGRVVATDPPIGMLFLHFTDLPQAIREIHRVLKPGGTFTTLYDLDFSPDSHFFVEWFQPVLGKSDAGHALPTADLLPNLAAHYF
jgi:ubiquinone/menaquinone biosynthesis C-methylase UbiE